MNVHLLDWKIYKTQGAEAWRKFNKDRLGHIDHPRLGQELEMCNQLDRYIRGISSILPWGPVEHLEGVPVTGEPNPLQPVVDRMRAFSGGSIWRWPIYHLDSAGCAAAAGMDHVCFTARHHVVMSVDGVVESHYFEYLPPQPTDIDKRLLAALSLLGVFRPREVIVNSHYVCGQSDSKRLRVPYDRFEELLKLWNDRRTELINATSTPA